MQEEDEFFYIGYRPICIINERDIDHFYLDSGGNLTIGRGHLVAEFGKNGNYIWQCGEDDKAKTWAALQPYLYVRSTGKLATNAEIDEDIHEVINKAQGKFNYNARYYISPTCLKFTGIEEIWQQDISKKLLYLRKHNSFFNDPAMPFEAKLVLLDLAFQSGEGYFADNPSKKLRGKSFYKSFFAPMQTAMLNNDVKSFYQAVLSFDDYLLGKNMIGFDRGTWRRQILEQVLPYSAILFTKNPANYDSAVKTIINESSQIQTSLTSPASHTIKHNKNPTGAVLSQANGLLGPAILPSPIGLPDNANARIATPAFEPVTINPNSWASELLKIKAPISDALIVSQLTGYEGLSQPYQFHVTVYSQNTNIQANQLLTKPITVQLNHADSNFKRYFHGVVSRLVAGTVENSWRQYTFEIVPTLSLLSWEANCRIFRNMSAIDIIQKLTTTHYIAFDTQQIKRQLTKRDYCVQYGETTLNFIQRLLEDEGIFYYFIHEQNKHTLVLSDQINGYYQQKKPQLNYSDTATSSGKILQWEQQCDYYTDEFLYTDYNFLMPHTTLQAQQTSNIKLAAAKPASWHQHPGKFTEYSAGKMLAQWRAEAEKAWHAWIEAMASVPLFPGQVFSLVEHPDPKQPGDYIAVTVHHYAHDATHHKYHHHGHSHHYQSSFKALSAKTVGRPKHHTTRPKIYGHQTAIVVGDGQEGQEAYIDKLGCVCVRFHWDREHKRSCWVRVAHRWAGKHWGMIFHPRIGQEVIVNFEHGDPERPLIIGSVYNAKNMPPYELPLYNTRSGIKTRSTKQGSATQFNELYFEDKAGEQTIFWHAQKDFNRVIEHTELVTVNKGNQLTQLATGKSTLEAAKAIEFKVGSNTLKINTQGVFINGQLIKFAKAKQ